MNLYIKLDCFELSATNNKNSLIEALIIDNLNSFPEFEEDTPPFYSWIKRRAKSY
jgi:hypothetical protein